MRINRTLSRHEATQVILIALRHMGTRLKLPEHLSLGDAMLAGKRHNDPVAIVLAARARHVPIEVGGTGTEVAEPMLIETAQAVFYADVRAEADQAITALLDHRSPKTFLAAVGDLPVRAVIEVIEDRAARLVAEGGDPFVGKWLREIADHFRVQL
jgi:hypothetical protein